MRVADDREHLGRKGTTEPETGLDGCADDDELGPVLVDDLGEVVSERALARADDPAPDADAVRVGDRRRVVERRLQYDELGVEVRVERQLLRNDERRDEDDLGAAVTGEAAGEVEGVLGLLTAEQRDDDAAVADRGRPPREAAGAARKRMEVRTLHYRT
jgi:hypothetical protein